MFQALIEILVNPGIVPINDAEFKDSSLSPFQYGWGSRGEGGVDSSSNNIFLGQPKYFLKQIVWKYIAYVYRSIESLHRYL